MLSFLKSFVAALPALWAALFLVRIVQEYGASWMEDYWLLKLVGALLLAAVSAIIGLKVEKWWGVVLVSAVAWFVAGYAVGENYGVCGIMTLAITGLVWFWETRAEKNTSAAASLPTPAPDNLDLAGASAPPPAGADVPRPANEWDLTMEGVELEYANSAAPELAPASDDQAAASAAALSAAVPASGVPAPASAPAPPAAPEPPAQPPAIVLAAASAPVRTVAGATGSGRRSGGRQPGRPPRPHASWAAAHAAAQLLGHKNWYALQRANNLARTYLQDMEKTASSPAAATIAAAAAPVVIVPAAAPENGDAASVAPSAAVSENEAAAPVVEVAVTGDSDATALADGATVPAAAPENGDAVPVEPEPVATPVNFFDAAAKLQKALGTNLH